MPFFLDSEESSPSQSIFFIYDFMLIRDSCHHLAFSTHSCLTEGVINMSMNITYISPLSVNHFSGGCVAVIHLHNSYIYSMPRARRVILPDWPETTHQSSLVVNTHIGDTLLALQGHVGIHLISYCPSFIPCHSWIIAPFPVIFLLFMK